MKETKTHSPSTSRSVTGWFCALLIGIILGTGAAQAREAELAIHGYDPVAYFTMIEAVKGSESISHETLDYKWLFANEQHRAMFMADPMRYMPNYGVIAPTIQSTPGMTTW